MHIHFPILLDHKSAGPLDIKRIATIIINVGITKIMRKKIPITRSKTRVTSQYLLTSVHLILFFDH